MSPDVDGNAIVYCEGAFNTPNGKTAHGLVRMTDRYRVLAVVDSRYAGGAAVGAAAGDLPPRADAGMVLDGRPRGIPIVAGIPAAIELARDTPTPATHLVVGLAPDGGRLSAAARTDVRQALELGLHVDSGLHDFLSDDPELVAIAERRGVRIRDVRKPPPPSELHFYSGKIAEVESLRIAVLGTDSAVGKRTTAWLLVAGFRRRGHSPELVGTGQTAWMQGARYSLILDSLINDFVSGEIEHATWRAWHDARPDVIVIEGQGSLMNPAYPGGYEILAAARPDLVVLQHAPARRDYDGFPGHPIHPLARQIRAIEIVSDVPVVAVAINHEGLARERIVDVCAAIARETGLPAHDVLDAGPDRLVDHLAQYVARESRCRLKQTVTR